MTWYDSEASRTRLWPPRGQTSPLSVLELMVLPPVFVLQPVHKCWAEWKSACLVEDRQTARKKPWSSKACSSDVERGVAKKGEHKQ